MKKDLDKGSALMYGVEHGGSRYADMGGGD